MSKRTILLATEKPFAKAAVDKIQAVFDAANYKMEKIESYKTPAELEEAAKSVDGMIIRSDLVGKELLDKCEKLKIVVRAGAGYDNIDLPACHAKEVIAMNTPGQNANAVAELVFGMMITSARNGYDGTSGFELRGRTLGLYGFGAVARCVHNLAKGFGMTCKAYDPPVPQDFIESNGAIYCKNLDELSDCDYISIHVPLLDATKESITKEMLMKMPKGATIINSARPEVISEVGMLEALTERADLRYLSDVPPKNADAIRALVGDKMGKRVIFTAKKMGAQTAEANDNAGIAAANQIVGFFEEGITKFKLEK